MVKSKHINGICIGAAVLAALITLALMFGDRLGLSRASAEHAI